MKKQTAILDFFKGNVTKRPLAESNAPNKKPKTEEPVLDDVTSEKLLKLSQEMIIFDKNMGASWFRALEAEFSKPYFKKLNEFVEQEISKHQVYPELQDIWTWTKMCSLPDVKVVIIGQDPYHNPGQAHGLCFSVRRGVQPPPSLINIYKELQNDIPGFKSPGHGDLTEWAKQGVLLLNATLTVRKNAANSHADKGWDKVTDSVIKCVSDKNNGVVFLLWGAFAQKKAACVDKKRHHLLKSVHPSPLSAMRGFFGCKHFSECNRLLNDSGKVPIDWNLH